MSRVRISYGVGLSQEGAPGVKACLATEMPIRKVVTVCCCSKTTVQKIKGDLDKEDKAA